jgi:hypothetical protein
VDMRFIHSFYEGINFRVVRPALDIKQPGVVEITVSHPRILPELLNGRREGAFG